MKIIPAKTSGFCFGVNKAVRTVYELLDKGEEKICTLGPIIHNEQVVDNLKKRGVQVCSSVDNIDGCSSVVIRAHGVSPEIYDAINSRELKLVDATCPYVKKIHKLVKEKFDKGYKIIIIGDKNHPEVIGINGWCNKKAEIINEPEEVNELQFSGNDKICVVGQTTITKKKWDGIIKKLEEKYKYIEKNDTICNATERRQNEAVEIASKVDMMLVIGGKNSSNTQKLYEICRQYCENTYKIETAGEIPPVDKNKIKKIGVTAGASTPEWIIKEVLDTMEELNKNEKEMSFEEAFENSMVTLQSGSIVKGKIIGYNNSEVYVDLGYKSDGTISMEQFSDDPDFDPAKSIKIGDEVEVFVIRVNDMEGTVQLSKKKVDSMKYAKKIEDAFESKEPVKVKVIEAVKSGVVASAGGVRIFVPGSQLGDKFVKDLSGYVGKVINVRIIEYNKQKRKFVGSERVLLKEEHEKKMEKFWSEVEVGKVVNGAVKSLTDFGAFVDIGGIDGLIHMSELSWGKIKHPSEVLKVGDNVEVRIIDFDREKNKISLGFKKAEDNPWYKAEEKFVPGNIVKGKVVRLVPFGAFVEIEKGIDGLVHISQISNVRLAKPGDALQVGQEVEAKIVEANIEEKKIGLSIKEVNPIDPENAKKEKEGISEKNSNKEEKGNNESYNNKTGNTNEEAAPSEHKEEMGVTIADIVNKQE